MEVVVDIFEKRLKKMGTTDLEANLEKLEAVMVNQKSLKKRPHWKLLEH
jgi:hypothetical protein